MKKFFTQLVAIVATLGLQKKFETKTLSAEEMNQLTDAYNKAHGEGAFAKDFAEFQSEQDAAQKSQVYAESLNAIAEELGLGSEGEKTDSTAIVAAIKELKNSFEKMASKAEEDKPTDHASQKINITGAHTKDFAFGVQNPMFSASKRWNKLAIDGAVPTDAPTPEQSAELRADFNKFAASLAARYAALNKSGQINRIAKDGVDFSAVAGVDMSDRFFQVRQDMLISRIIALPSLAGIFQTVSNVQAGQVFTNMLAKSVSQAYQAGRVFKGNVKFEPETAIVDKAMSKIKFDDMSELELTYLNYLNTNGSDPVKWSLIEWIVLELATQLRSERNERAVMGYRVEPKTGEAGHERFASTGVVYRILGYYYKEHKVLPFTAEALRSYTANTIGNVLQAFVEEIKKVYKDWKKVVIYVNENDKPLYSQWLEANYKTAVNFVANIDSVPHYGNKIVWVPNMDSDLQFIFASIDKNIVLLENKPGEEFDMKFQRDLEEVITYSYWKEGAGAGYSGVKCDSHAALLAGGAKNQLIFCNLPAVGVVPDATTVDAEDGRYFITGANSKPTALTDIENAVEGVIYHVECGATANATTIAKAGKFSEIKSAFAPTTVGEWIDLYFNAEDQKFYEAARS